MKKNKLWLVIVIVLLTFLAAACGKAEEKAKNRQHLCQACTAPSWRPPPYKRAVVAAAMSSPAYPARLAHSVQTFRISASVIPQRLDSGEYSGEAENVEQYLLESLTAPDTFIAPECPSGDCQAGLMPASIGTTLSSEELQAIVDYLIDLPEGAAVVPAEGGSAAVLGEAPALTEEEFAWAKQTFFERCAGCHGTLRNGATGPGLTPDLTLPKGTLALSAIIFNGTTGGMPDWGKQGFLTQEQTDIMAKYLQNEPPAPPELSLGQMQESWQLITPVDQRPTEPQTERDWQNYFIVTLRDAGQVAIIDGDTFEIVNTVDSGYAVHITRMSATGRYAYVIGRDGRLALIDLWMETPEVVARVQTCYDARSVEVSKYHGPEGDFTDKYAIAGCYWPPHFVILDGQTLEPMKVVSTRSYTYDTGEYHPEPRVASHTGLALQTGMGREC